jgi:rSAM/selenodomain-associated transferase 1
MAPPERTPLLIFVKAPRLGEVKTRLAKTLGAVKSTEAYNRMAAHLLGAIAKWPEVELCHTPDDASAEILPWRRRGWTLHPQGHGDLGQRLSAAISRMLAQGASRVLIIGSDCPDVTLADIEAASLALNGHDLVLGPAQDGGYWLIGLRESRPELFREMPWSTNRLLAATLDRARQLKLQVHLLRKLADIDTEEDWHAWLARTQGS